MRRALVLTNETARHPFRQHLILERDPPDEVQAKPKAERTSDLAFFGMSFTAFFVIIFGMIL
jgi:hypothetical protein